jgi:Flp pilus assembly protein TadD
MRRRHWLAGLIALPLLWLGAGCANVEGGRYYQSGTLALDAGDTELAVAHLERAAQLVPDASEVHNHLGLAYAADGRHAAALAAFRRAVDIDCDNQPAQRNLAAAEAYAAHLAEAARAR